ncbi:MAG: hypothetical protein Q9159_006934 [Coniocarpon cinnabarinum]
MSLDDQLDRTRNIGIIAHIDAGKTTTTERMLYYSGFTRRLGNVDDGSTVTDFLPAERARGITIQSAAITFHWPPALANNGVSAAAPDSRTYTVNLIDTPGHADFTFEVIRSLRVLDGAICILDGVAGVEAQTEKVWAQSNDYQIPRLIFVNKLDRDGAAFHRCVKEVASRLHTWPALCQIPWWKEGKLVGIGDVVGFRGLLWEGGCDGTEFQSIEVSELRTKHADFAEELHTARSALIEVLTEHDDVLVEGFLEANEDFEALSCDLIWSSMRRVLRSGRQRVTPVFLGASFRNIGVQPLLDAVNILLPAPPETTDPMISLGQHAVSLRDLLQGKVSITPSEVKTKDSRVASKQYRSGGGLQQLSACVLAFKVVNDVRRGVLVYVRVYAGTLQRNCLLYNTNLGITERALRLMRMYANDAIETDQIEEGQIGVIAGLKHARTGDTLINYTGASSKSNPPSPFDVMQLQPIRVPPPLFFTSIEPASLSEEKNLEEALSLLLREDPSLHLTKDPESGQIQLAGMGELHLEIAKDKLINDYKVRAAVGQIEISYRETIVDSCRPLTRTYEREISGRQASSSCRASVEPIDDVHDLEEEDSHTTRYAIADENFLSIRHPTLDKKGKSNNAAGGLPLGLSFRNVLNAIKAGVVAVLARGPAHSMPLQSVHVKVYFDPSQHLTPASDASTITAASRLAVTAALRAAASKQPAVLMEPVMLATIAVNESAIGDVVHDLNSARGAQVLSLDAAADDGEGGPAQAQTDLEQRRLTPSQIDKVYAPPDPFGSSVSAGAGYETSMQMRQIKARVPLKEMVGYLRHLRSLTGGRGSFIMNVDKFERMTSQRMRSAMMDLASTS